MGANDEKKRREAVKKRGTLSKQNQRENRLGKGGGLATSGQQIRHSLIMSRAEMKIKILGDVGNKRDGQDRKKCRVWRCSAG